MGDRYGDKGAEIEVSEIGGSRKGIVRHHRIQGNIDSSEKGNVSGGRTGGGKTVTSCGALKATANIVGERARRSGA